jgi:hypothetical protein
VNPNSEVKAGRGLAARRNARPTAGFRLSGRW